MRVPWGRRMLRLAVRTMKCFGCSQAIPKAEIMADIDFKPGSVLCMYCLTHPDQPWGFTSNSWFHAYITEAYAQLRARAAQ